MRDDHELFKSINGLLSDHPSFTRYKESESAAAGELLTRLMLAVDVEEPVFGSFTFDNTSGEASTVLVTDSQLIWGYGSTSSEASSVFVAPLREVRLLMPRGTVSAIAARNAFQSWPGAMGLAAELRGGERIELQLEPSSDRNPATRALYERILNAIS